MGIGGISIWQLLIVLLIVVLLFGTKKLRNMGGDLGTAIKNFRQSVKNPDDGKDGESNDPAAGKPAQRVEDQQGRVIDADTTRSTGSGQHSDRSS